MNESEAAVAVAEGARYLLGRVYGRADVVVVARELVDLPPRPPVGGGVVLRRATAADEPALAGLWPRLHQRYKASRFRQRLAANYACLAAFDGERVVAIDWLTESDDASGVDARPGTCLGVDLHERRDWRDRGIGLALLAYSLEEARQAGYRRQAAFISAGNARMLAAAVGLLGFTSIGTARRVSRLGRTRWEWQVDGVAASGPRLLL